VAITDWTITRGTFVIGTTTGTGVKIGFPPGGFPDLWSTAVTSHDTLYQTRDGAHAGLDVRAPLLLSWEFLLVKQGDPDAVMDQLTLARTAYAPVSTSVTITVTAPGSRTIVYTGRPRALDVDRSELAEFGKVRCRVSFFVPTGVPTSGTL